MGDGQPRIPVTERVAFAGECICSKIDPAEPITCAVMLYGVPVGKLGSSRQVPGRDQDRVPVTSSGNNSIGS